MDHRSRLIDTKCLESGGGERRGRDSATTPQVDDASLGGPILLEQLAETRAASVDETTESAVVDIRDVGAVEGVGQGKWLLQWLQWQKWQGTQVLAERTEEIEHDKCYRENDNTNHPEPQHTDKTLSLRGFPVQGTTSCSVGDIGLLRCCRDRNCDGGFGCGGWGRVRSARVDKGSGRWRGGGRERLAGELHCLLTVRTGDRSTGGLWRGSEGSLAVGAGKRPGRSRFWWVGHSGYSETWTGSRWHRVAASRSLGIFATNRPATQHRFWERSLPRSGEPV